MKLCCRCHQQPRRGRGAYCLECQRAHAAAWREAHREEIRVYNKAWRLRNVEGNRRRQKKYRANLTAEQRAGYARRQHEYYERNATWICAREALRAKLRRCNLNPDGTPREKENT